MSNHDPSNPPPNKRKWPPPGLDPDNMYEQFPSGRDFDVGSDEGFGVTVRINDRSLFTDEALSDPDIGPTLEAFCSNAIRVYYTRFSSSTRESEQFIHKPVDYLAANAPVARRGSEPEPPIRLKRLQTLVMNHERTLAWRRTSSILVVDDSDGAEVLHKQT
jgi:hypothetical protein